MKFLKGVLLPAIGLVAIVHLYDAINHKDNEPVAAPSAPAISEADMLASSEIYCNAGNFYMIKKNTSTTGKAVGFFVDIKKGKGKLYALDQGDDTNGTLKAKGKIKKETYNGETFYTFSEGETSVQFQFEGGKVYSVLWLPDSSYIIQTASNDGCSLSLQK